MDLGSLFAAQNIVMTVLGVAALGLQVFSLIDVVRQRADAFPATGNQTKSIWLAITGVCVAVGFVSVLNPLNIFNLIAIVGAGVYLARVRPAVLAITGRGGSGGPYGGW